jgi:hypothetical protein
MADTGERPMAKQQETILPEDERAAKRVDGLSGWVSRQGQWWDQDERMARWSGATHVHCSSCGEPTEKTWTKCATCRATADHEKYARRERRKWNGTDMLYAETVDRWFADEDELRDYLDVEGLALEDLGLVIGEPIYALEIDPKDYYCDDLSEDGEVPGDIEDAFVALNAAIRNCRVPLSWRPGQYAAIVQLREGEAHGD